MPAKMDAVLDYRPSLRVEENPARGESSLTVSAVSRFVPV
jgi:hypothetical protein